MTDTTAQTGVDTSPAPAAAPEAKAAEAKRVPTAREALEKATAEVAVREERGTTETEKALRVLKGEPEEPEPKAEPKPKAAKPEAKAEPKPKTETKAKVEEPEAKGPQRGADGKFQSSQPKAEAEDDDERAADEVADEDDDERAPPKRFNKQAQAEWEKVPESVRHETRRMQRELEKGLSEHQEKSRRYQEVEPYEELANAYGLGGLRGVLADYEGMARTMATDPLKVFDALATRHGLSLQKIAAHVLQQDIDEYAEQAGEQIASLTQQLQTVTARLNQYEAERMRGVETTVEKFQREHPRFEELQPTIRWILKTNDSIDRSDPARALKEAYDMAERLKPSQVETSFPQPAAPATRNDLSAQTAVASKSVTGAPGQGSNPNYRKPSSSPREALMSAMRRTGIA
jgi:hypothetical protein